MTGDDLLHNASPGSTSRRCFLIGAAASVGLAGSALAARFVGDIPMKPGDYVWTPERAAAGAVVVIVSIPEQLVHVYRNGVEIGRSTCSTGKEGHRTPTGVFTILEKQREHVSSIYKGAQMPNMERLTWGGIALHAGNLPGYPASHGCIRLPKVFSAMLYEVTHVGAIVIIADERTQPTSVVHPGLLMPTVADVEARAIADRVNSRIAPHGWQTTIEYPLASVVISRADGQAYLTRDGRLVAQQPVSFSDIKTPVGTHVYTLLGPAADGSGLLWLSFGLGKSARDPHIVAWKGDAVLRRVAFYDAAKARAVAETLHPGTTLMITDASAPRTTRSVAKDFKIMTSETAG